MRSFNDLPAGIGRHMLLFAAVTGSFAAVMALPPIAQDPAYHAFADQRAFFHVPRFLDVITNLPFFMAGISGIVLCLRGQVTGALRSWAVFFIGVALIGIGSGYYHIDPSDRSLLWDRLPMTIGFMAVLVAVLSEHVHEKIETYALLPAVLTGMASVLWWSWTGDLRLYCWVQLLPFVVIPAVLFLYRSEQKGSGFVVLSLLCYVPAKVFEHYDQALYEVTRHVISGHSLKHVAAAAGCAVLLFMLERRDTTEPRREPIRVRMP